MGGEEIDFEDVIFFCISVGEFLDFGKIPFSDVEFTYTCIHIGRHDDCMTSRSGQKYGIGSGAVYSPSLLPIVALRGLWQSGDLIACGRPVR